MPNTIKTKLTAVLIALSLCLVWFYFTRAMALGNHTNTLTPSVFTADARGTYHYDTVRDSWKARVGGIWLAGRLLDTVAMDGQVSPDAFRNVFGLYHAGWLLLTFALLICLADNPVFVIPLVFAGVCSSLNPPEDAQSYPWDMPAMFFFTLSCLLWQRGKYVWMLAVILLGSVFKETVAVTAFAFFFTPMNWKRRLGFFGAAFCGCLLIKLWISYAVMGHVRIFTQGGDFTQGYTDEFWCLKSNLVHVFSLDGDNPLFANAGTLALVLCLPVKTLRDRGIKCVIGIFLVGQLFAGNFQEFRIFMEVLPVSVLYLVRTVQNWNPSKVEPGMLQPAPVARSWTGGVTKSGILLTLGVLLAIVVGVITADLTPIEPGQNAGSSPLALLPPSPEISNSTNQSAALSPLPEEKNRTNQPALQTDAYSAEANNFAWSLATSPEATNRNGALAVELAQYACERTHYRETVAVGTLAAAYAEAGRFDEAIATAQRACALASGLGEPELLKKNQELLVLYQAHKAYHEAANSNQTKP